MTYDKFIGNYISAIKQSIQSLKDDLAKSRFIDMYQVGDLQGRIIGLEQALELLESAYAEQDN